MWATLTQFHDFVRQTVSFFKKKNIGHESASVVNTSGAFPVRAVQRITSPRKEEGALHRLLSSPPWGGASQYYNTLKLHSG